MAEAQAAYDLGHYGRAYSELAPLAKRRHGPALELLATMFENGHGVQRNLAHAAYLREIAKVHPSETSDLAYSIAPVSADEPRVRRLSGRAHLGGGGGVGFVGVVFFVLFILWVFWFARVALTAHNARRKREKEAQEKAEKGARRQREEKARREREEEARRQREEEARRQREEKARREREEEARRQREEKARREREEKARREREEEARREREEKARQQEKRKAASAAKMRGYAAGVTPLVRAELAREVATQFDYERLRAVKDYFQTSDDADGAVKALHDDLLELYREGVEGHLQSIGAMSDGALTAEDRQTLIDQQTQACAELGLQAIKRSDLVREMLGGDVSRAVTQDGSGDGIKIEKKRSWRELRGNVYRT